jgi:hypothetical protein
MNELLGSDVSNTREAVSQTPHHPPLDGARPGPVTYAIKVLSRLSREPAEGGGALSTVLFQRTSEGDTIEISAETDAENLLAELPELLDAALSLHRALWPAQRTVGKLPASFFPLLAEESRLVRRLTEGGGAPGGAPGRAIERRRVAREAMIVRDVAWEVLRNVLPPERRAEVDALIAFHETEDDLARSMEAIAALVEAMLEDAGDAVVLSACDIDAAYAAALRRHAAALRVAMRAPGEGAADEEAPRGRGVLRLIGMAYRALRTEAFMTVAHAAAPPRARGRG